MAASVTLTGRFKGAQQITGALKDVQAELTLTERAAKTSSANISKTFDKVGSGITSAGKNLSVGLTAPFIALAGFAARAATEFESNLTKIVGLVGVSREQVNEWRDDLKSISAETGKPLAELAEGLFFVTSAGAEGAEAINILRASAQAAAAGLGETKSVADAVTSAINAYGKENLDAATATGVLVATVREGKAEADSIARSLGRVLPVAAQLNVSFDQVGAAVAAFTRGGLSAEQSATTLSGILTALLKPSKEAGDALESIGLSSADLRQQIAEGGLFDALQSLSQAFAGNQEAIAQVFPNVEGLRGVLNLVGANAEDARQIFKALAAETGGALNNAFAAVTDDAGFRLQKLQTSLNTAMIKFGTAVLPLVIPLVQTLTEVVQSASMWFGSLDPAVQENIVIIGGLAAAIGPLLLALGAIVSSIGAIIPIVATVGGALAALAGGPITVVVAAIIGLTAAWVAWGDDIIEIVDSTVSAIDDLLGGKLGEIFDLVGDKIDQVTGFFRDMWREVVGESYVPDMIDEIENQFNRLPDVMVAPTEIATNRTAQSFLDLGTAIDRLKIRDIRFRISIGADDVLDQIPILEERISQAQKRSETAVSEAMMVISQAQEQAAQASGKAKDKIIEDARETSTALLREATDQQRVAINARKAITDAYEEAARNQIDTLGDVTSANAEAQIEQLRGWLAYYESLGEAGAKAAQEIRDRISDTKDVVKRDLEEMRDEAISNVQAINKSFGDLFADVLVDGADFKEGFISIIKGLAKDLISTNIQNILGGILTPGQPQQQSQVGGLFNVLGGLFGGGGQQQQAPGGRAGGVGGVGVGGGFGAAGVPFPLPGAGPGPLSLLGLGGPIGAGLGAGALLLPFLGPITEAIGGFGKGLLNVFSGGADAIGGIISGFGSGLQSVFSSGLGGLGSVLTNFVSGLTDALSSIIPGFGGLLGGGGFLGGIGNIFGSIGSLFGGLFQHGGSFVTQGPTLIGVGEVAERVTVRPLGGTMPGGGSVIFQGPVFMDEVTMANFEKFIQRSARAAQGSTI